ncbi:MAG TPA: (Fe-S)-binding protein [Nitrospirae bacterium]|nr:(Fe-S)-binding protein [Nitrospirota bacterium]
MDSEERYRRELRRCVLCGSCKAACPTYSLKHAESAGPRGRLRLLWALSTGELRPTQAVAERVFSCLLCGACSRQCSAGVDILEAMYHGRAVLRGTDKTGDTLRRLVRFVLKRPALSARFFRLARPALGPLLSRVGLGGGALMPAGYALKDTGTVFAPADTRSLKGRVLLFSGCSVNYLSPHLGESFIRVVNALGYEVVLPKREVCCGAPLRAMGFAADARDFARRNVEALRGLKADAIVSLCPTCVVTLREQYGALAGAAVEAVDAVSFLSGMIDPNHVLDVRAAYHDPCHALHGLGQYAEPRDLLGSLGVDIVETEGGCCGLAGTFSLSFRDLSEAMLRSRVDEFRRSGAEILVTSCPGCLFHLSKSIRGERVFHAVEVVEEGLLR